ncbi:MAG: DUF1722 domain-containing protein [Desulfobacterales bacterium]
MLRIWDIQPGYLSRLSLLGEHRELHAVVSVIVNRKKGYAVHPETLRWRGYGWALGKRHRLLAEEMALRGYREQSPVRMPSGAGLWPEAYLDAPELQFDLLAEKYKNGTLGRIPLPVTTQQLWSHHKYSVLARDHGAYREIGRMAAVCKKRENFALLARRLTELSRRPPSAGGMRNALMHMWGHVSQYYCSRDTVPVENWSMQRFLHEIRRLALEHNEPYLTASTALGELGAWL